MNNNLETHLAKQCLEAIRITTKKSKKVRAHVLSRAYSVDSKTKMDRRRAKAMVTA